MFQPALEGGLLPTTVETANLVLIPKPKRGPDLQYRPLCLLNSISKIYEKLVKGRLEQEIEQQGGLAKNQYGFTKGKSTIDAIRAVIEALDKIKQTSYTHRKFVLLITVDIQKAFNTANWQKMVARLEDIGISGHLIRIIQEYLQDREIVTHYGERYTVSCGVPQGSVLGPLLWNVLYDKLLRTEMPDGIKLVGFADDLAVTVTGKHQLELENKTRMAMKIIKNQLVDLNLQVNTENTEAILLSGRRKIPALAIAMEDDWTLRMSGALKYLGVYLGKDLNWATHVNETTGRAEKRQ